MARHYLPFALVLVSLAWSQETLQAFENKGEGIAFFEKKIRPLLSEHCYKCHSSDSKSLKGGLLLDSKGGWMRGGDSGDAIVPGDSAGSPLINAVGYEDSNLQMPPKYRLSEAEIEALAKWIDGGAPDPRTDQTKPRPERTIDIEAGRQFWAFQKPVPQPLPTVENETWPSSDLDHFLLSDLEQRGLEPNPPASREVLIRRATFDLAGLPPTPTEIDAFVNDPSNDKEAFATVLDRLLGSPQFGERWGRHWLDIVRYGESMGRTRNYPFPYAWKYRNYVIDAFNTDLPFDRFVTEQVAGDLLESENAAEQDRRKIATGFLALGAQDLNERNKQKFKMDLVDEQIDVTGRAFMALTTSCARCHDHKFDPIPTKDYYALAGIFGSTDTRMGYTTRQGGNKGDLFKRERFVALTPTPSTEAATEPVEKNPTEVENAEAKLARLKKQLKRVNRDSEKKANKRKKQLQNEIRRQNQLIARLKKKGNGKRNEPLPNDLAMGVTEGEKVADCRVNLGGDPSKLGDKVPRGFLQVVDTGIQKEMSRKQSGRSELARWLTDGEHPLTARVQVNRIWHHLFGHGIVRTVDNFGEMGNRPSNQPLLDQLALRFVDLGWSQKKLIREIMLSSAYRMGSDFQEANFGVDPDNDHFWRVDVQRLEVEAIRDAVLAVSGDLDKSRPGPSPVMSLRMNALRRVNPNQFGAASLPLRSVYLPVVRGHLPDVFEVFDFAEPSQVIGRRDVTTVSPQALYFMNSPFVLEQAAKAANKLNGDEQTKLSTLYRKTLGRTATDSETTRALEFLKNSNNEKAAWAGLQQVLFASAEFRYLR